MCYHCFPICHSSPPSHSILSYEYSLQYLYLCLIWGHICASGVSHLLTHCLVFYSHLTNFPLRAITFELSLFPNICTFALPLLFKLPRLCVLVIADKSFFLFFSPRYQIWMEYLAADLVGTPFSAPLAHDTCASLCIFLRASIYVFMPHDSPEKDSDLWIGK